MRIKLKNINGSNLGIVQEFDQDSISIGRMENCDCLLQDDMGFDKFASREHAEIRREGDELFIYDLKSMNGTFVNGKQVDKKCVLKDGDQIGFGAFGSDVLIVEVKIAETLEGDLNIFGDLPFPTIVSNFNQLKFTGLLSLNYLETKVEDTYGALPLVARIFFQKGEIKYVNLRPTDLRSQVEAFNHLIQTSIKGGKFLFEQYKLNDPPPKDIVADEPIQTNTMSLLLEALTIKDEDDRAA